MKKINYFLLGATSLLLASCANEDLVSNPGNGDGTADVTISLSTPQLQSRAFGDGTTAQKLFYAVYDVTSSTADFSTPLSISSTDGSEEIILKKEKTFRLLTDHTYTFVFWAESKGDNPYTVSFTEANGPKLTADYQNVTCNNENLDAFYGVVKNLKVTGNIQMDAQLYRPFAQINIGTNDYEDAKKLGRVVKQSSIKVQSYTNMNLLTDEVDVTSIPATWTFASADIPDNTKETFPVQNYEYLAMTYILVPNEKKNVSVTFDYTEENSTATHERTISEVPVQRNHRTNIYGQVLTSDVALNIEIKPGFEDPDYTPSSLEMAAAIGGSIILEDDFNYTEEGIKRIYFKSDAVVDLNGKTVTGANGGEEADGTFFINNGANVTIKNGNMETSGTYPTILVWADNKSTVTIESGTYISNGTGNNDPILYIGPGGGTIYIKGGTFINKGKTTNKAMLNCYDDAYDSGDAKFIVSGGTFYGFDPAHSGSEREGDSNFLAPGYKSVESEIDGVKVYTVVPATAVVVEEVSALKGAIKNVKNGDVILVTENMTQPLADSDMPSNVAFTIKGVGAANSAVTLNYLTATGCDITFEDLTVGPVENAYNHTAAGFKGTKNIVLNNCVISAEFTTWDGNFTFNNCKFEYKKESDPNNGGRYGGYLRGGDKIVFNNCEFDNSAYEKKSKGILVYSSDSRNVKEVEVNNCTFIGTSADAATNVNAAVEIHAESNSEAGIIKINNCKYDEKGYQGGLWREINGVNGAIWYTVYVDGVEVQTTNQK